MYQKGALPPIFISLPPSCPSFSWYEPGTENLVESGFQTSRRKRSQNGRHTHPWIKDSSSDKVLYCSRRFLRFDWISLSLACSPCAIKLHRDQTIKLVPYIRARRCRFSEHTQCGASVIVCGGYLKCP